LAQPSFSRDVQAAIELSANILLSQTANLILAINSNLVPEHVQKKEQSI